MANKLWQEYVDRKLTEEPATKAMLSPLLVEEVAVERSARPKGKILLAGMILLIVGVAIAVYTWLSSEQKGPDFAEISNQVLYLEVYDQNGACTATASGFLVDDTTLITNYHVIEDAYELLVYAEGSNYPQEAEFLMAYDEVADIAVLRCDPAPAVDSFVLGDSDEAKQGDNIYTSGYPLGVANTLSDGIISSVYTDEYDVELIQITAPISGGSSGGTLLNEEGQVIGVVTAGYIDGENMNVAVSSNTVKAVMEQAGEGLHLREFFLQKCPQSAFESYYPCVRMICAYPEDVTKKSDWDDAELAIDWLYWQWADGEATEESLIALLDEYGTEQYGGKLQTITPGSCAEELEEWCFDPIRRIGDIEIIETEDCYILCYFSDAVDASPTEEEPAPEAEPEEDPAPAEEKKPEGSKPVAEEKPKESTQTAPAQSQAPATTPSTSGFRIEPFWSFVFKGDTLQLTTVPASENVTWTSSESTDFPVSADGTVTVVHQYNFNYAAIITATTDSGLSTTCGVVAKQPSPCSSSDGKYVYAAYPKVLSIDNVVAINGGSVYFSYVDNWQANKHEYAYLSLSQADITGAMNAYRRLLTNSGYTQVNREAFNSADEKYSVVVADITSYTLGATPIYKLVVTVSQHG